MKKVHNPHDKYFRSAMSDLRVAREFFEMFLTSDVLSAINLDTLSLQKSNFVDADLQELLTDMLYSVDLNHQSAFLYILVEHQSSPDSLMPFRLLRYMVAIMQQHIQETGSTLPIVIPLVFYNGQKSYPYSTDLFDLFGEQKNLVRELFLKPFKLIDVSKIPDESLKQLQWMGTMAFMQKHIFARDFMPYLKQLIPLLKTLESIGAKEYIISTITYLVHSDLKNVKEVVSVVSKELSKPIGDKVMTLAERLHQDGKLEGRLEGKLEGKIESIRLIAANMIARGFDVALIMEMTGLSHEEVQDLMLAVR